MFFLLEFFFSVLSKLELTFNVFLDPFFCYFHFVFWFTCMFCCLVLVIIYSYLQVGDLQIKRSGLEP